MNAVAADTIVEVLNPFGRAKEQGIDLIAELDKDPVAGGAILDRLFEETSAELKQAEGGVFYRLQGANPAETTPMQYGGYFLERDRELLASAASPRILFVDGTSDVYFDFVGDLPAELFGYDIPVSEVRAIRGGEILADSPEADVRLIAKAGPYRIVQKELVSHSC